MPVFLSNVDDYLAPSQACVNPLFTEDANAKKGDDDEEKKEPDDVGIVPRKRTAVRRKRKPTAAGVVPTTTRNDAATSEPKETAKVSIVDCLACSGCVTSAETVLVEQHSLQTLHEKLQSAAASTKVVVTISPASWADVVRHLQLLDDADVGLVRRKLATALHQACRASIVLDAHVPLQWSWQEAAREFCYAYQEKQEKHQQPNAASIKTPLPSMAVSSTQSQRYDGTVTTHTTRSMSHLPLLSATCPALVCLVEKSHPSIVPHLSTTKSPMAMAGAYIKSATTAGNDILHIAIMPCHDKKLEASRKDFLSDEEIPDVDLVLTSNEWVELMAQAASADGNVDSSSNVDAIRIYIESLEPAVSVSSLQQHTLDKKDKVVLVQSHQATDSDEDDPMEVDDNISRAANDFFAHSSGGYADFIFRYAATHLFGFEIHSPFLPWKPVSSSSSTAPKIVSARVAASRKKDYHAVTLYQLKDGTYSMSSGAAATTVLRFATAYGFQTLQRILQPMDNSGAAALEFDYVEAMACPSGCLNGGGQVRLMERETPKETRQRVSETRRQFQLTYYDDDYDNKSSAKNDDIYQHDSGSSDPFGADAQLRLHTRYHVVPALQHSLGAAAGVAVQDTQW